MGLNGSWPHRRAFARWQPLPARQRSEVTGFSGKVHFSSALKQVEAPDSPVYWNSTGRKKKKTKQNTRHKYHSLNLSLLLRRVCRRTSLETSKSNERHPLDKPNGEVSNVERKKILPTTRERHSFLKLDQKISNQWERVNRLVSKGKGAKGNAAELDPSLLSLFGLVKSPGPGAEPIRKGLSV